MLKPSIIAIGLLTLLPTAWAANEQDQARALCEEAVRLEQVRAGSNQDLTSICNVNVRPPTYWECTLTRMRAGMRFDYASSQCETPPGAAAPPR